jgi:hypothetical protein
MEGLPSGSDVSSGEDEDGDDSDDDFMARKRDRGTWMVSLRTSMKLSVMTRWVEIWKRRRNCLTLNLWLVAVEITSEVHIYGIVPITAVVGRIYK